MFFFRTVSVIPRMPERIKRLGEIAKNLWFSWNPRAQNLFAYINEELWWEVGHNPVKFLIRVGSEELERVSRDPQFQAEYDWVISEFDRYNSEKKWFENAYPHYADKLVAYFCAEFGFHESLPMYSGGLGVLAGDHIKSASDLGVPMVGVGLLYKHGYFTQRLDRHGQQHAFYPHFNFREMPLEPVTRGDGGDLIVEVYFRNKIVCVKVWKAQVGRVPVYLLDSDVTRNNEEDRKLTARLYGGGDENRIQQEIILGIGGVRALRAMDIHPYVWHLNEGHAAFSSLERLREMVQDGVSLASARESVVANTIFTTHTPVPAGHDVFSRDMMDKYLGHMYNQLGMEKDSFFNLGKDREQEGFNMTLLALRLSGYSNGVSKIHGEVSRKMFHPNYSHLSLDEVPVYSVTNGVHLRTWLPQELEDLLTVYLRADWEENSLDKSMWERVHSIPDKELWNMHKVQKERTVQFIRDRLQEKRMRNREEEYRVQEVENFLRPGVLTIGFARRFTVYKRATLIFRDKKRLAEIINNPEKPLQIVFSGKAHPDDKDGQEMIKEIYAISNEEPFRGKIVFIEDFGMNTARHLLQGVDVWLNTPRWPKEASGTSGMKAASSGVLHCSVPDGWWPEGFNGENGFTIGHAGDEHMDRQQQDINDSEMLYELLENVIVPAYYNRDEDGIPRNWVQWMKNSISTIPAYFSTRRMVREYVERFYINLADRGIRLTENNYEIAGRIKNYKQYIEENWHQVFINNVSSSGRTEMQQGEQLQVKAGVRLGPIHPGDVVAEITFGCEGSEEGEGLRNVFIVPMHMQQQVEEGNYLFQGEFPLQEQGVIGYTVRVRPNHPDFAHEYELPLVAWANDF